MRYGSVCSGIGGCAAAWHPLGWETQFFSEIEPFPSAVLAHHHPTIPNLGDFTKIGNESNGINLLVGGTPCQSFSIAGLRKGLDDERGNLALEFIRLAYRSGARWVVWENVPGVLSSSGGRDFASFIGGLTNVEVPVPAKGWKNSGVLVGSSLGGFSLAWRVLDAQYFGVPQRRRRVFVVGHLGDWRAAAAVLFERNCLQGNTPPSRKTGESTTHSIAPSLTNSGRGTERTGDTRGQDPVIAGYRMQSFGEYCSDGTASAIKQRDYKDATDLVSVTAFNVTFCDTNGRRKDRPNGGLYVNQTDRVNTLTGAESSTLLAFDWQSGGDVRHNISTKTSALQACQTPAVFGISNQPTPKFGDNLMPTLNSHNKGGGSQEAVVSNMAVRRLTPRECERLQGFKDDYTLVPYKKKFSKDGHRYKALGNSWAVPVVRWIGKRIEAIDAIKRV